MTPKLPSLRSIELIAILEKKGFRKVRQSGSHVILKHSDGRRTTVPVHKGKTIGKGLLRQILRDTGLRLEDI